MCDSIASVGSRLPRNDNLARSIVAVTSSQPPTCHCERSEAIFRLPERKESASFGSRLSTHPDPPLTLCLSSDLFNLLGGEGALKGSKAVQREAVPGTDLHDLIHL